MYTDVGFSLSPEWFDCEMGGRGLNLRELRWIEEFFELVVVGYSLIIGEEDCFARGEMTFFRMSKRALCSISSF